MLFSERKGLKNVRESVQRDGMDDPLRNGLWNSFDLHILRNVEYKHGPYGGGTPIDDTNLNSLIEGYWCDLFKNTLDTIYLSYEDFRRSIRDCFLDDYNFCQWYEIYDLIEFTAQNCPAHLSEDFVESCNKILEREMSAYRFVNRKITDLTSEEEIKSIEETISLSGPYPGVRIHLSDALDFLSDRKSPNYRNSVKESISAVESLCESITGKDKATLGDLLKKIEKDYPIHGAFKEALSKLYGYTSDEGGIRHALLEESTISYSDAKFMLVSCSAFVNYILGKGSEKTDK